MRPKLKLVSSRAAPKRAARRRRRREPVASDRDPRAKEQNRTFELTLLFPCGEHIETRHVRIRVAKGGVEDNVFCVGTSEAYCGLVSEQRGRGGWTVPRWGNVPVSLVSWAVELVADEAPRDIAKEQT